VTPYPADTSLVMALFVHFIDVHKNRNAVILEYARTRAYAVRIVPRHEGKVSVHNARVAFLKYRTSLRCDIPVLCYKYHKNEAESQSEHN
jgi:hypothetical protein